MYEKIAQTTNCWSVECLLLVNYSYLGTIDFTLLYEFQS